MFFIGYVPDTIIYIIYVHDWQFDIVLTENIFFFFLLGLKVSTAKVIN